jgi:hypothetical protein
MTGTNLKLRNKIESVANKLFYDIKDDIFSFIKFHEDEQTLAALCVAVVSKFIGVMGEIPPSSFFYSFTTLASFEEFRFMEFDLLEEIFFNLQKFVRLAEMEEESSEPFMERLASVYSDATNVRVGNYFS